MPADPNNNGEVMEEYCAMGGHYVDVRDMDKASGWCKMHAPQNIDKCVIVCESCHRMKVTDWRHRKTCSVCREKAAGHPRHRCPLCGGTKRRVTAVCEQCVKHVPMIQYYTRLARAMGTRYGWSRRRQHRWVIAKTLMATTEPVAREVAEVADVHGRR